MEAVFGEGMVSEVGAGSRSGEARECTEKEARSIERNRDTDKAWPADQVRAAASLQVDVQRLRRVVDARPVAEPSTNGTAHEDDGRNGFTTLGGMREAEGNCSDRNDRCITYFVLPANANLADVDAKCANCGAQVVNVKWSDL